MIIGDNKQRQVGEPFLLSFDPVHGKYISPPIPGIVTEIVSRKEFIKYCKKESPKDFKRLVKLWGMPDYNYYTRIKLDAQSK